jgi:two-component system, oxyanion-binding sensor
MSVFRPDLYDAALGTGSQPASGATVPIGAFAGPAFDPNDITGHLRAFDVGRRKT